ncbi:hypothetical protein [Mycobacterium sp. CnD-18-1]|uniref:hypothetical protein n=1 Tax=Mycobacterium sp. CnD-18-1 TaxID=2917744 RepID=UPI001EF19E1D|nr:hypothetical protein [Mycobacterium sp. CnD-18-1]MCG7609614.1 hypothetical protein [Mycobacterium sp. CnD-18-1]
MVDGDPGKEAGFQEALRWVDHVHDPDEALGDDDVVGGFENHVASPLQNPVADLLRHPSPGCVLGGLVGRPHRSDHVRQRLVKLLRVNGSVVAEVGV